MLEINMRFAKTEIKLKGNVKPAVNARQYLLLWNGNSTSIPKTKHVFSINKFGGISK
jgi:hypothetical protein